MKWIASLCSILFLALSTFAGAVRGQGFSPEEAVIRMKVPDGFQVKLAACEPEIRQPLSIEFDARGRMWVIQYIQYPNPAGLKAVKVDRYLRTVYDRMPEPPPKGPIGADKITILEDKNGDGRYHKVRDFVTGLNLASGMCIGHGGVFVVQPPYLLFYPDRNGDDIPDSDPQVLLKGFGMEDAHAFANSLQWGPDGWLYGAQGSTVTANIRGITFQQGIWRYHPLTKEFELFSEGGGNTWGLDFDRHGNVIAGTNYGNAVMLHQVQGAYYVKNFGKHGELQNPNAYGYFEHVPYKSRFKGGHVTCGGVVYQGGSFPERFQNTYIAGNLLANALYWHTIERQSSSFINHFGGDFLIANDTWFRPVDCLVGPDGSLFVADWYDKRANHVDPIDNWDKTNGRIYKIEAKDTRRLRQFNLEEMTSRYLVGLLDHRNDWMVRTVRRILAERRDPAVIPLLRQMVLENRGPTSGQLALESLWALYVSGGFDDGFAATLLDHPNEDVRAWNIRLLGDAKKVAPAIQRRLVQVARADGSFTVRSQLACSCKRLAGKDALPIIRELLQRAEDVDDPHIPLLLWWAIEDKAVSDREQVLGLLDSAQGWHTPLIRRFVIERLGRRYLAEGTDEGFAACARLLAMAPAAADADLVIQGMDRALEGRRLKHVSAVLEERITALCNQQPANLTLTRVAMRLGNSEAYERALSLVGDAKAGAAQRVAFIEVLGQMDNAKCVPTLLQMLDDSQSTSIRQATLSALQPFQDPAIADMVLARYSQMSAGLRSRAQSLLFSRPGTTRRFLEAVDGGRIALNEVGPDQLRRIALHHDPQVDQLVEKHWGKFSPATAGAKLARIGNLGGVVLGRGGAGDPVSGKLVFDQKCATCHTLFGEGGKIGPDLTGTDRKDRTFLLTSIVDPSAVIRKEYLAYVVSTTNGRLLTGLLAESTPKTVTLLNDKNERTIIPREEIEAINPSPQSLMPEGLLDDLEDPQIRDLFSYLQADHPRAASAKAQGATEGGKTRLKVCLVSGSVEYKSDESLAAFQKYLEDHYNIQCTRAFRKTDNDLPGLENLETCDVALFFTRRLTIAGDHLERIKKYCQAGKPIVAVRTASHGFQNWLAFDKEVLGGNYSNHYKAGPMTEVQIVDKAKDHLVLAGVKAFRSVASLYKNTGVARDVEVLLTGSIPEHTEPIAWARMHNGGRVFYTSLGHPDDFKDENFKRMVVNALYWTAKRTPAK
jgi:putative membrane-bound dehydrogenase-like protein